VLDRIALHQTRLRTPGLTLDGKGIALGTRGVVLLPSVDRLVGLLAIYCRERSLEDLLPTLAMRVVRSKLGTREVTFECAAESSDRMDRLAEAARLVGGVAFTGTTRHFVRYRDGAAPFGYDAVDLLATDAPLALYHDHFSQAYEVEQSLELYALLLRLTPRADASSEADEGPRIVVAEQGLGPAVVHYFVRSEVHGEVCVVEWPPESALDDGAIRRWILRVPKVPKRMRPLLRTTPGIHCFVPAGRGVAVEAGFRHPIELRSCPLFNPAGLVLLRGRGGEPWVIERLPPMGEIANLGRIEMRGAAEESAPARPLPDPAPIRVRLRLVASSQPWRRVTATWISLAELPLLRRLAYALARATIARTEIAVTPRGALLRSSAGIDGIPIGTFFVEIHPRLYVPAGHDVVPAVSPDVLARALDVSDSRVVFIGTDSRALAIDPTAFGPLELSLLEAPAWEKAIGDAIANTLDEGPIELRVTPLGMRPAGGMGSPRDFDRAETPRADE
jgi:hypothetical protein